MKFFTNLLMKEFSKIRIINDPVHGFIKLPSQFIYTLIDHSYIQRLRRIKQLGMSYYVFPGATHTRFQHAIGATHLMSIALQNLMLKGHTITNDELEGALIAILLHDIGHGPFSHALENSIIEGLDHEIISAMLMEKLNEQFHGRLSLALDIFYNRYKKKFLHQLISSQLDMDRMDYLKRDSFYTGVAEGVIGSDRIIKMLNVVDDNLVIEEKGIYSIEKFIIARRLMYWQVYLHKTVISAEFCLIKLLQRAKELTLNGEKLFASEPLQYFLKKNINNNYDEEILENFLLIDDDDIMVSAKSWMNHKDKILSTLAKNLINRNLPKILLQKEKFDEEEINIKKEKISKLMNISLKDTDYFVYQDTISNYTYSDNNDTNIRILFNDNQVKDITEASDIFNISALLTIEKKYFLCYPREL